MTYDKNLVEKEIELLSRCGTALHGYSKTFRVIFAEKNQQERIMMMEEILQEAEYDG